MCVFVRVFIWQVDVNKNQKKPSGETDDSLTWAILYDSIEAQANTWTNSVLYIEPSDVYLPMISHSVVELAAAVYVILILDHHGKPSGCRNYTSHFKMEENIIPWTSLNCKQCSYISYEYTRYGPHSGVTWGRGVCCVACQTWWYFLRRSDPISGVLWRAATQMARLGLGQWQWHTEAVGFWHTAVTNCEEKVREICSGASIKDMEIQPTSPGCGLAQMKSLNHEYSEGEPLFTAANLVFFMEVILVVSSRELMF